MKKNMKEFFIKLLSIAISTWIGIASLFFVFDDYLSDKIDEKINNPNYVKLLSITLRPFLIFNGNEVIIYDHGASAFIDSLQVISRNNEEILSVIIYPKKHFQTAPLLESIGSDRYFATAERGKKFIWKYTMSAWSFGASIDQNYFRLEILP